PGRPYNRPAADRGTREREVRNRTMRSIQRRVVPHLPRWMGIVSGAMLVLVGLIGPAWMSPLGGAAVSADTVRIADGQNVLASGELPMAIPPTGRLALTPPMGWNGFNHFFHRVSAATV